MAGDQNGVETNFYYLQNKSCFCFRNRGHAQVMQKTAYGSWYRAGCNGRPRISLSTQMMRMMKLLSFFLFAVMLSAHAEGTAQRVTVSGKNIALKKLFAEIKKQTGYVVFGREDLLKGAGAVTVDVHEQTVRELLTVALNRQPLDFEINEATKTIVLTRKAAGSVVLPLTAASWTPVPISDIRGRIIDSAGNLLPGVSVGIKGTQKGTVTDDAGEFTLGGLPADAVLVVTGINIVPREIAIAGRTNVIITVQFRVAALREVTINVNTGYQTIPRERATGSFTQVNNELLNRRVSTNILERLEDVASGIAFNKNYLISSGTTKTLQQTNQSAISVRGRSTINSNPNSLIIVDNFPYDGDISTINPNDVESVTILKDAAAASIWGAFSGNGVIVITTKRGVLNQRAKITLNSNLNIFAKPDLYYTPALSASEYIDIEKFLYDKGFYNGMFANAATQVSPVVELLRAAGTGALDPAVANERINALRNNDARSDISRYMYQQAVNQQHSLNITGGGAGNKYFISAGIDYNKDQLVNNTYRRASVRASNTTSLLKQRLELITDIAFAQTTEKLVNMGGEPSIWPYVMMADENGNALVAPTGMAPRKSYTDTTGMGLLLNWAYRPLEEMNLGNRTRNLLDYHLNVSLKYRIMRGLEAKLMYQYNRGLLEDRDYKSQETFFTRDMINRYSQVNFAAGTITRPVPLGGILDRNDNNYNSYNARFQLNYGHSWNGHAITAIAGTEVRELNRKISTDRLYGHYPDISSVANMDYVNQYRLYTGLIASQIPSNLSYSRADNNFLSYFANAGYTYKDRYTVTLSGRRDESNLFGAKTNQKGVPLWSAGLAYTMSSESFYHLQWLPFLKWRVTRGVQGNVNSSVAAITTATYSGTNIFGGLQAGITNLPNAQLRWEKVSQLNFGLDFASRQQRVSGSIDYYIKKGTDLIALSPLDPTSGSATFTGNSADMQAKGIDLVLNSVNLKGRFSWNTSLLFNYAADKITAYKLPQAAIYNYMGTSNLNPVVGNALYAMYSYKWAGLNAQGNPQVLFDDKVSTDYSGLLSSMDMNNLLYHGSLTPTVFGSIRNSFGYNNWSFSFLVSYKMGHYFRRASLSYTTLYNVSGGTRYLTDFSKRWQKPGDELTTQVPAMLYPEDATRDAMYRGGDLLVEKGDHIRLQDMQLGYDFTQQQYRKLPFTSIRLYALVNNIGILWRANKHNIDPDYVPVTGYNIMPVPRSVAFGIKIEY